jgi:hypothetical protein
VLIVESEHDRVIPHQVIVNYREACISARSLTYRMLNGADHGLSNEAWQRAYTLVLVNWFTEMVFGARAGGQADVVTTMVPAETETPEVEG